MIIPARFNGPAGSGNGGYSAGIFAIAGLGPAPAQVTLRQPPPLETTLELRDLSVYDAAVLVATVEPATVDTVVAPVSFMEANDVAPSYPGFVAHPFPTCYVCGTERTDGLGLHPGRLPDGRMAAPFVVPDDVSAVTLWAALDCPGGWSVNQHARPFVLGRIAARVDALPAPGDECVVMGELIGSEGRKGFTRTTVYSPTGAVLATAHSTWIALP
jgi:hypothetical protein